MARKPRVHVPGAIHHVMLRGNAGQPIFADDTDRQRLCELLADGVERFDHRIHAYCLMGNHLHLAIEVGQVSLSREVQNLAFRYTHSFNHRERRTGHLFQGRFRSLLVDRDSYLLELVRYIHCNPMRSGLVRSPEAWTWSGHRTYLGQGGDALADHRPRAQYALRERPQVGPAEVRRVRSRRARRGVPGGSPSLVATDSNGRAA